MIKEKRKIIQLSSLTLGFQAWKSHHFVDDYGFLEMYRYIKIPLIKV